MRKILLSEEVSKKKRYINKNDVLKKPSLCVSENLAVFRDFKEFFAW